MPSTINYKGLTILSEAGGDAAQDLINNFRELADRIGPCNYSAETSPTATNDGSEGYEIGSRWLNANSQEEYLCVNNTVNAAVWINTTVAPALLLNNYGGTTQPLVTDDEEDGYQIGSRWLDTVAHKEYVCIDNSVGAALWVETTGGTGEVPSNRTISTTAPLSGGGDLSQNRTLSLSLSATNLRNNGGSLDTVQDIATTSTPQFAGLRLQDVSGSIYMNALNGETKWAFYNDTVNENFMGVDNVKTTFGTDRDASIYYDGSGDLFIDPGAAGTVNLNDGNLTTTGHISINSSANSIDIIAIDIVADVETRTGCSFLKENVEDGVSYTGMFSGFNSSDGCTTGPRGINAFYASLILAADADNQAHDLYASGVFNDITMGPNKATKNIICYGLYNSIDASQLIDGDAYGIKNLLIGAAYAAINLYGCHSELRNYGGLSKAVFNYMRSMNSTEAKTIYGIENRLRLAGTTDTAYGCYVSHYNSPSAPTINDPSVDQIALYINWTYNGTDANTKKWAVYNASTNATSGKVFLGLNNIPTYWGTDYGAYIVQSYNTGGGAYEELKLVASHGLKIEATKVGVNAQAADGYLLSLAGNGSSLESAFKVTSTDDFGALEYTNTLASDNKTVVGLKLTYSASETCVDGTQTISSVKNIMNFAPSSEQDNLLTASGFENNLTLSSVKLGKISGLSTTATVDVAFDASEFKFYGVNNDINVTSDATLATIYGCYNKLTLVGGDAYGTYTEMIDTGDEYTKVFTGYEANFTLKTTDATAYGLFISQTGSLQINDPIGWQVAAYVDWTHTGTDASNYKWAFYNASTNATSGKMFMGQNGVKTYWGTNYLSYIQSDSNSDLDIHSDNDIKITGETITLNSADVSFALTSDMSLSVNSMTFEGSAGISLIGGSDINITTTGSLLVSVGSPSGSYALIVDGDFRIANAWASSGPTESGVAGTIRWDSNYLYICVAQDTWKCVALSEISI